MKTLKTVLLYFLMVVLIFFLFLPPVLRMLNDDGTGDDEEKKDVYMALNCVKDKETLDMNYIGDNPQSFFYRVPGNKSNLSSDNITEEENDIIRDIFPVSMISYSEADDISSFSIKYTVYETNHESMKNYILNINQQKNFFTKKGFTCKTTEI